MIDIKGYEGLYAITSCGKVWSYRSKRFLTPTKNKNGYYSVLFSVDKKQKRYYIHRLVLENFNPIEGMEELDVGHLDENPSHNYLSNLSWMTRKENINYGKRNEKQGQTRGKVVVCLETGEEYYSAREASRQLNITQSGISRCCVGQLKSIHGLHFRYKEDL